MQALAQTCLLTKDGSAKPYTLEPTPLLRWSNPISGMVDGSDPLVRQQLAAIETGYRIGRHVRYRRAAVEAWIETQADHRPVW